MQQRAREAFYSAEVKKRMASSCDGLFQRDPEELLSHFVESQLKNHPRYFLAHQSFVSGRFDID